MVGALEDGELCRLRRDRDGELHARGSRPELRDALALERTAEAVEHVRRAAALAPDSAEVYRHAGQLLQSAGQGKEAEAALLKSLDLAHSLATGLSLAKLYQSQRRHGRAVEVLATLLDAHRDAYEAADGRADAWLSRFSDRPADTLIPSIRNPFDRVDFREVLRQPRPVAA